MTEKFFLVAARRPLRTGNERCHVTSVEIWSESSLRESLRHPRSVIKRVFPLPKEIPRSMFKTPTGNNP